MGRYVEVHVPVVGASGRRQWSVTARAYVPDEIGALSFEITGRVSSAVAIAGERIAAVDALARASSIDVAQVAGLLSRSEGIGSSTIEGYNASLEKVVVEGALAPRPHTTTTAGVIRDGIEAVAFALDALGDPDVAVTPGAIESVQRRLLANQGAHLRGFRTVFVQVGGDPASPDTADFVPPPHAHVERLMADLCAFINSDGYMHPVARAAIAHAQFETIHPFPDGNGRTGRALLQAMLRRDGLMESTVLPVSASIAHSDSTRRRYVQALGGTRDQTSLDETVEAFCDFLVDAARRTETLISATEAAVARLRDAVREHFRSDSTAHAIVDLLVSNVGLTASGASAILGVSEQNTRTALARLQELHLVDSRAGGRTGRVYFAPAILHVIGDASGAAIDSTEAADASDPGSTPWGVVTGPGRGRPQRGERCGVPLRTGGTCMRPAGHGSTGHRARP